MHRVKPCVQARTMRWQIKAKELSSQPSGIVLEFPPAARVAPASGVEVQEGPIDVPRDLLSGKGKGRREFRLNGPHLCRQRPTLPHTFACSTIGPAGLNFRVRDGNGWIPRGKITDKLIARASRETCSR